MSGAPARWQAFRSSPKASPATGPGSRSHGAVLSCRPPKESRARDPQADSTSGRVAKRLAACSAAQSHGEGPSVRTIGCQMDGDRTGKGAYADTLLADLDLSLR